ncbi:hypothetical protein QBC36DRAFT_375100 [Triangularia setosa]|uniref:Uncharacterized protein n=1 Tax=Triangularia setosa TaxID=2587417 RepID=A0AAN6WF52_9PEZI|nr:hypothetical protein QBC36DRAFT_375100 [Podospora setosa]
MDGKSSYSFPAPHFCHETVSYLNGNTDILKKLGVAKADALKQAQKSTNSRYQHLQKFSRHLYANATNPVSVMRAQSRPNEKLQPNIDPNSELTVHSILSRPISLAADNTSIYRGTTATTPYTPPSATTAIRSTPRLVYHHPRRCRQAPQPQHPQSQTYTTSYPCSLTHPNPNPNPPPKPPNQAQQSPPEPPPKTPGLAG